MVPCCGQDGPLHGCYGGWRVVSLEKHRKCTLMTLLTDGAPPPRSIGIVSHQPDAFFVEGGAYAADLAFVGGEDEFLNPVQDQYAVVQAEVDALLALGVNKIILLDHHEGYLDCASEDGSNAVCDTPVPVTGVDIIVSAEEANQSGIPNPPFNTFFDEDYEADYDYPVVRKDANGDDVYVVGVGYSGGLYKQVGNLMATFDAKGKVVSFDERSGPVSTKKDSLQGISSLLGDVISTSSVSPGLVDGLIQPPAGVKEVWDRIEKTALIQESLTIVGETTNLLQDVGSSTPGVFEANLGRLAAESSLWFARQQYPDLAVDVALKNSGGIRANIAAGPVTRFSIAGALAFNNLLSIVEIDGAQLLAAMENSVAGGSSGGAFGFIDGAKVTYDLSKDPVTQVATLDKPSRVVGLVVTRADGTEVELVNNGKAVKDALSQTFVLATNSFLTNGGGDGYFSLDRLTVATELAETPVGEQEILELYITDFLGGMIDYPNPTPAERANYIEA
jgi:5'-nucleotidase/UDP-sugar diphosphatase